MKCPNATPTCTVHHHEDKNYECPHAQPGHVHISGCDSDCQINHCGPCVEVNREG